MRIVEVLSFGYLPVTILIVAATAVSLIAIASALFGSSRRIRLANRRAESYSRLALSKSFCFSSAVPLLYAALAELNQVILCFRRWSGPLLRFVSLARSVFSRDATLF